MTTQQIQNAINLCKGAPMHTILRAFKQGAWNYQCIKDMANYFGCEPEMDVVAMHLFNGK